MNGYVTTPWSDFAVAVVGAAAALTGLLFVAVSVNIERILAAATLTGRSGSTLILFVIPLVIGIVVLVPDQRPTALGIEIIAAGVAAGAGLLWISRRPIEAQRNRGRAGCCSGSARASSSRHASWCPA